MGTAHRFIVTYCRPRGCVRVWIWGWWQLSIATVACLKGQSRSTDIPTQPLFAPCTPTNSHTLCEFEEYDSYGRAVNRFVAVPGPGCGHPAALAEVWAGRGDGAGAGAGGGPAAGVAIQLPFEMVSGLIRARSTDILLQRGSAYVMQPLWAQVFQAHFRRRLHAELVVTRRTIPTLMAIEADRLARVVQVGVLVLAVLAVVVVWRILSTSTTPTQQPCCHRLNSPSRRRPVCFVGASTTLQFVQFRWSIACSD